MNRRWTYHPSAQVVMTSTGGISYHSRRTLRSSSYVSKGTHQSQGRHSHFLSTIRAPDKNHEITVRFATETVRKKREIFCYGSKKYVTGKVEDSVAVDSPQSQVIATCGSHLLSSIRAPDRNRKIPVRFLNLPLRLKLFAMDRKKLIRYGYGQSCIGAHLLYCYE